MASTLILSTLEEGAVGAAPEESECSLVTLAMDERLAHCMDSLDTSLGFHPPTSLAEATQTWLPRAVELADELSRRAAQVGEVLDWDELPDRFSQVLVASQRVLPLDLLPCRGSLLGTECVVGHYEAEGESCLDLSRSLEFEALPLRRIAHASTYYPGATSLRDLDVVAATLGIDNRLAIEHYFYPSEEVARGLFARKDVDVLHFECHGTGKSLQIDNPHGMPIDVRQLYSSDGPCVYLFLGCSAGETTDSVAPVFVKKGAKAALGAYCEFLSGGSSADVSLTAFYDALYEGLVRGQTLGDSVKAGRRAAAPDRIYYCTWMLFGNPNIQFSPRWFGGEAHRPRGQTRL